MAYNKIRMVVTDLDDTLLSPEKGISREAISVIRELEEKNIKFTFITGRPPFAVHRFADQVAVSAPIVSCNGALIYDGKTRKVLQKTTLSWKDGKLAILLSKAAKEGLTVLIMAGEIEYTLAETDWTKKRADGGRTIPLTTIDELQTNTEPIYKVNIMSDDKEKEFSWITPSIREIDQDYSIAVYGSSGCEIVAREINKKKGLESLCRLCNLPIGDVLAIGDNENDNEMLKAAGIGAVVANGAEETRKFADYICKRSYTEGVLEAIRTFV